MKQGWEIKKLCQLSKNKDAIVSGPFGSNLKVADYKDIGIPILRLQNIGKGYFIDKSIKYITPEKAEELKYHSFITEDIVLAKLGIPIGKTCLIPTQYKSGIITADIVRIRPDKDIVNYRYLEYFLNTDISVSQLTGNISGATRPRVNLSDIRNIEVPVPSLTEQERIVEILDKAFSAIEQAKQNAEKNLKNAKELFDSYLNGIFTNKGEDWEKETLKDLTTVLGDGLHGTPKYTIDGEYHFINGNNLADGVIELKENTKRVSIEEYNKYKKNLTDRTVLVSINGTLGNVAFYNGEKIILGKSACYFNLKESINRDFVRYVFKSPYFMQYAHKEATGATIKNVSLKTMREFIIPVPDLKTQQIIVQKLDALQAKTKQLESIYQQKIIELEDLKKSILQKAFNGDLS